MKSVWLDSEVGEVDAAFTVDERVYSVNALLRTAYWFTDRAYVFISKPGPNTLRVHLKIKPPSLESPQLRAVTDLAGEFANSLLDHQLREEIEERTGKIRELLVAKALAEGGILDGEPPGSPNDPVADRDGVTVVRIGS
jgi:His-Xaa-Ser system protein HxsD